jgi:hypothetical protein
MHGIASFLTKDLTAPSVSATSTLYRESAVA